MIREVVRIDEDKCDGCGLCVPSCEEGAIKIVNGKAKLVADRLCDGLGACLGHCPQGAITIDQREADDFDEAAVAEHLGTSAHPTTAAHYPAQEVAPKPSGCPSAPFVSLGGGCPSARFNQTDRPATAPATAEGEADGSPSELTHWPVQLRLFSPAAPILQGARLLLCADCVPVAYPDFQSRLLRGRSVVIACPKLDDPTGYVEKLAEMMRQNDLAEIVVAHMEVPCCNGIVRMVTEARQICGSKVPVIDVMIGTDGQLRSRREIPLD